ncbi:hypothetical protein [Glutamicibacter sp. MCAF14]|uniref:hypothetical protein n=1 Tax=Glutamicibacter sp. MCAF14 TaxID=3233043 RepID=UPI003F9291A8
MKKAARIATGIIVLLAVLAMIAGFTAAIWTSDERWSLTAFAALFVAFFGIMASTYPGWDD